MQTPSVRLVPVGKLALGSLWWALGEQLHLTICAKATFSLRQGEDMELVDPEPLCREEQRELPSLNVLAPADLIPRLPRPEITLWGHAMGQGAARVTVRLAMTRDGATVLDKRLEVVGDRDEHGEPLPFTSIALAYDRAIGGIGFPDNPLGRGKGGAPQPAANVLHPADREDRVASFAPVPAAFAARKRRLGKHPAKQLGAAVAEIPDGFDWRYFQAAPEDQQVDIIAGDEWIWLEGIHPVSRLRTSLPCVRAVAKIGAGPELPLRAESLHINADEGRCTLVWRASIPCPHDATALVIAGAAHPVGTPVSWPALDESPRAEAPTRRPPAAPSPETTIVMEDERMKTAEARPVDSPSTPFAQGAPLARPAADLPGAPWSPTAAPEVPAPKGNKATLPIFDDTSEELARREAEEAERKAQEARAAEERRRAEAERFAAEQQAAREADARREAERVAEKGRAAAELKKGIYGGFKRS